MKYSLYLPVFILLLTNCIGLNPPIVSDTALPGESHDFETYYIAANSELSPELSNSIESVIRSKMNALGYKSSINAPDLHIHYTIYEDNFTTLSPIAQSMESASLNKKDKLKKIKCKHGSIYISLYNKENNYVVWRGFTDGHSLNPRIVKSKAYEVMDHYQLFASAGDPLLTASSLTNQ